MQKIAFYLSVFVILCQPKGATGRTYGYDILSNNHLNISPARIVGNDTCRQFAQLILKLMRQEQQIRMIGLDTVAEARQISQFAHHLKITDTTKSYRPTPATLQKIDSIDSISFRELKKFAKRYGIVSVSPQNYPDSALYGEIVSKYKTLSLHLSDKYGLEMMEMIEESIAAGMCNEYDLMDYTVTYVFRRTEFKTFKYFIIPLPDITTNKYAGYYLYATAAYLSYCLQFHKDFEYMLLPNYFRNTRQQFVKLADLYNNLLYKAGGIKPAMNVPKLVMELLKQDKAFISFYTQTPVNSFLICTYPKLIKSPSFAID